MNIDDPRIKQWLKRPDSFAYYGDLPIGETWSQGPVIRTRDSDLMEESNADALIKWLESKTELEDLWQIQNASHWAVGWVDHLSFRVLNDDGTVCDPMVNFILEWKNKIDDYPLLDEDDYSDRQFEAFSENVESQIQYVLRQKYDDPDYSEEIFDKVWRYLMDKTNVDIGGNDGNGYYPGEDEILEILEKVGYPLPVESE